jgi:hypothetical protein
MKLPVVLSVALVGVAFAACSGKGNNGFGDSGTNPGGDDGGGCTGFGCNGDAGFQPGSDGGTSGGCNPNPANFDVPGNNCDDDGDGVVDNPIGACDTGLPANPSAAQLAKALGICPNPGDTWGIVSAKFTQGYKNTQAPNAQQAGALPKFGSTVTPRQGSSIGIISSGLASPMDCDQGNFNGSFNCAGTAAGAAPPGYPKTVNGCDIASNVNNVMNVVLEIKVPANAKGFSFDFDFFSGEWPDFVCTEFNDSFVAWLTSTAWAGNSGDFNISFDSNKDPVNVNNGFFQACAPANTDCSNMQTPAKCTLGESQLLGTGFDMKDDFCGLNTQQTGGGATGWLTTTAPVAQGETITIQFMVWNTGDDAYDSLALLDNWQWTASDTSVSTTRPPN